VVLIWWLYNCTKPRSRRRTYRMTYSYVGNEGTLGRIDIKDARRQGDIYVVDAIISSLHVKSPAGVDLETLFGKVLTNYDMPVQFVMDPRASFIPEQNWEGIMPKDQPYYHLQRTVHPNTSPSGSPNLSLSKRD